VRKKSGFGKLREEGAYGGYFTVDEMKEIVAYCAERYITVIPEFDIPGHSSALLHAYPGLSCLGEAVEVKTAQGIYDDILCAGKDETFDVVFDILSDIIEIFPSEYIHIGGDEAPKKRWKNCPHCQERIKAEGLADEEALQGWFTNRIVEFLKSKGRKAIVWNESLRSGIVDESVTVQMWMDKKKLSVDFANNGGVMINSDFFHYYCDYPYGMTPLNKTYNYNPIDRKIKNIDTVAGVEAPIWTEYIKNFEHLCFMFFPRFTAVAETGWTKPENKNAADFQRRFRSYTALLNEIGINPAPEAEWNPNPVSRLAKTLNFVSGLIKRNN
jgi:hexosaminidase